jgi:hypothetical protein
VYQSIYNRLAFTPPVLSARLPAVVGLYGTAHNRLAACACVCVCVLPAGKASKHIARRRLKYLEAAAAARPLTLLPHFNSLYTDTDIHAA